MKNMQTKMLEYFSDLGTKHSLQVNVSYTRSNRGTLYFQEGLKTWLMIKFDFQDHYMSIKLQIPEKGLIKRYDRILYQTEGQFIELTNSIEKHLP